MTSMEDMQSADVQLIPRGDAVHFADGRPFLGGMGRLRSHAIQGKLLFAVLKIYFYNKGEGEGVGRVENSIQTEEN